MNSFGSVLNAVKPTGQDPNNPGAPNGNDQPWLISTVAKAVGTIAGAMGIVLGLFDLIDIFSVRSILVGVLLMLEGFFMILTEAPCCCVYLEFAYMPSTLLDKRPPWIKATIYLLFAAVPFLWYTGFSTFISCGLMMATSALYLLMALGKKADRNQMRTKLGEGANGGVVAVPPPISSAPSAVLVQNEELPAPTRLGPNNSVLY